MSAQHSALVSCSSHHIIDLSHYQKNTDKQRFLSRASLSFLMYAVPGKIGHWPLIKVNLSHPHMRCSRNKAATETMLIVPHTLPSLLIMFEQWKVILELNLVWKSSAKMYICLGYLGSKVVGVVCLHLNALMVTWLLGTLGWVWITCKSTSGRFRHRWRNSAAWWAL